MLTISRRSGESIEIGPDIRVQVELDRERNGRIKVRIEAPQSVRVRRIDGLPGSGTESRPRQDATPDGDNR